MAVNRTICLEYTLVETVNLLLDRGAENRESVRKRSPVPRSLALTCVLETPLCPFSHDKTRTGLSKCRNV